MFVLRGGEKKKKKRKERQEEGKSSQNKVKNKNKNPQKNPSSRDSLLKPNYSVDLCSPNVLSLAVSPWT